MAFRHRINNIKTLRFETHDTGPSGNGKVELRISYHFREPQFISVIGDFRFFDPESNKESLSISAEIEYDIHPEDFSTVKKDGNVVVLPKKIAQAFSIMLIGTARGILHVRTENTKFSHFIIPPLAFSKNIVSDVVINANQ